MSDPVVSGLDREAIKARCDKATMGRWEMREDHGRDFTDEGWSSVRVVNQAGIVVAETAGTYAVRADEVTDHSDAQADAEFIAHSRTDLPAVLAVLDSVESDNRRLREQITAALAVKPQVTGNLTDREWERGYDACISAVRGALGVGEEKPL